MIEKNTTKYDRQNMFRKMKSRNRQQMNHFLQMWEVPMTVSFIYVLASNPTVRNEK